MLPFLRGSRRGRKDESGFRTYSPFAGSPETSRNRVVGRAIDNDDALDDDEEAVDDEDEERGDSQDEDAHVRQPLLRERPSVMTSYFEGASNDHTTRPNDDQEADGNGDDEEDIEDEDGGEDEGATTPLLPIFSAAHLDRLPVYNITHAIRLLIVPKCETTLSWEQLRSPQVSQFLVKPIQSQIRTNHFNRATLCALVANCLQFQKECQQYPANVGVSRTRALISELLAMRLIKEFSTRELIDALSYDFDPLQGMSPPNTAAAANPNSGLRWMSPQDLNGLLVQTRGARVSTIEIAIRAQAKRFLAHPVVVQHLEAIWAGTIVFHSEADSLHRRRSLHQSTHSGAGGEYGTVRDHSPSALPADAVLSRKAHDTRTNKRPIQPQLNAASVRRSVVLYNPRDASLFKLSRLRVPRYRQVVSTLSFATLLALFLAVLVERSATITALEVVFWCWSIGYMLDEVVGFTEQGFGLYILSFWNAFDLGILLMFAIYFLLRVYGILLAEQGQHRIASYAYDVLGSTAILLFPRLFSVLDHYRYFSQLLIAFRMMAQDLMAVMVLIVIACSGFFVAFTLSFSDDEPDANGVAYALFQMVMGFTPAAWDRWETYNPLGQAMLTIFLFVCHFLVVTVLITVLTNSFMAIVRNAEEEHQFLFAVNTISMVKSDSLFSYVAPTNIIGWALSPLRYIIPFRQYLKFNRTIIKVTHFPLLFIICGYERLILAKYTYESTDLVANQAIDQSRPVAMTTNKEADPFKSARRLREPSVIGSNKDRALDEVFRRPYKGETVRTTAGDMELERRKSTNAVAKWMQLAENEGGASPPLEQPRSVVERLEHRRPLFRRATTMDRLLRSSRSRDFSATRSMLSDPDVMSTLASRRPQRIAEEPEKFQRPPRDTSAAPQETDADGDDENNDDSDADIGPGVGESVSIMQKSDTLQRPDSEEEEFYPQSGMGKMPLGRLSSNAQLRLPASRSPLRDPKVTPPRVRHTRNTSAGTTLLAAPPSVEPQQTTPTIDAVLNESVTPHIANAGKVRPTTPPPRLDQIPLLQPQNRTSKLKPPRPRPSPPQRQKTAPALPVRTTSTKTISNNIDAFNTIKTSRPTNLTFQDPKQTRLLPSQRPRNPSFNARALDLASEIGDNKHGPSGPGFSTMSGISGFDGIGGGGGGAGGLGIMPASFSEQLFRERELVAQMREERNRKRFDDEQRDNDGMLQRILLARMNRLEEGFREVLGEIRKANESRRGSDGEGGGISSLAGSATGSPRIGTANASASATGHGRVRRANRKAAAAAAAGAIAGAGGTENLRSSVAASLLPTASTSANGSASHGSSTPGTTVALQSLLQSESLSQEGAGVERPGTALKMDRSGEEGDEEGRGDGR